MEMALTFNDVQFDVVDHDGQPWLRGYQIGRALGYEKPEVSIPQNYCRHADEFNDSMTALIKLPSEGGEQETRIFSPRGCHLLAMLARTPIAKAFRKWALDVLDHLGGKQYVESSDLSPPTRT